MAVLPIVVCAVTLLRTCIVATSAIDVVEGIKDKDYTELFSELRSQLMQMEKIQKSLQSEVSQLRSRGAIQPTDDHIDPSEQGRVKRDANQTSSGASEGGSVAGTNGCPVVTPFSVGGSCVLCPSGPRGYPGAVGAPGRDGRDGRDAIAVVTPTVKEDTGNLEPSAGTAYIGPGINDQLTPGGITHIGPTSITTGAVYIRWGRSECPATSTLVYSGVAAGAHLGSTGSGSNQLCLPLDPVYDEPVAGIGNKRASIYSIEYQIDDFPARSDRSWHEIPCAVCMSPSRFAKLMVPGRNTCPSKDWTLEYGGYLMAERSHPVHQRSMYICVDREMEIVDRSRGNSNNRAVLDLVESRCTASGGGLPCGPYVEGYELTCALCTQ